MRKIKIASIIYDEGRHKVFFDSDRKYYFQNKGGAIKFCNRTAKYLNDLLIELNELSIFYYENYRRNIFLVEKRLIIDILERDFILINSSIEFCLSRSGSENYNSFLIAKFNNIFQALQSVSEKLSNISKKGCNTALINVLRVNEKRLSEVYENFQYWNLNLSETKREKHVIKFKNAC
jgi:hypothetical protein